MKVGKTSKEITEKERKKSNKRGKNCKTGNSLKKF